VCATIWDSYRMTIDEFLNELAEVLMVEPGTLTPETELASLETWDSVSYLSTIVMVDDKLGVALPSEVLNEAKTIGDIMNYIGPKLEQAA
jgi:acyl carrier protein